MIEQNRGSGSFVFVKGVSPVKQLREALNLSQREFANELGTTEKSVSRWETDIHNPKLSPSQVLKLEELASRVNLTLHDVLSALIDHKSK